MTTDELAFTLELHENWDAEATSESYVSLLIEVEHLLLEAPNVEDLFQVTDPQRKSPIGFVVVLDSGEVRNYIATNGNTISFSGTGELLPEGR